MIHLKEGEYVVSMATSGNYGEFLHCITNLGRLFSMNGNKWEYRIG